MSYLLQSKPKRRPKTVWIAAIAVFTLLALLITGIMPKGWLMNLAFAGARPLWHAQGYLGEQAAGVLSAISLKQNLTAENEDLKNRLTEREGEVIRLSVLEEENRALKAMLGRETDEKRVLAVVLSRPPRTPYDSLIIDASSRDPISVGEKVVSAGDIALGTVIEVAGTSAKVKLFSSAGESFDALVGTTSAAVVAYGKGGGNFIAEVPRGVAVSVGDPIILPSINPKVFGIVEDVVMKPTDSFQTVLFRSPVNMSELKWVEVISAQ